MILIIFLLLCFFVSVFSFGECVGDIRKRRELKNSLPVTCLIVMNNRFFSRSHTTFKVVSALFWALSSVTFFCFMVRAIFEECSNSTIVFLSLLFALLVSLPLISYGIKSAERLAVNLFKEQCSLYGASCPIICKMKDPE